MWIHFGSIYYILVLYLFTEDLLKIWIPFECGSISKVYSRGKWIWIIHGFAQTNLCPSVYLEARIRQEKKRNIRYIMIITNFTLKNINKWRWNKWNTSIFNEHSEIKRRIWNKKILIVRYQPNIRTWTENKLSSKR